MSEGTILPAVTNWSDPNLPLAMRPADKVRIRGLMIGIKGTLKLKADELVGQASLRRLPSMLPCLGSFPCFGMASVVAPLARLRSIASSAL